MARLHLDIPDADLARFKDQAQREGKTLNEWLRDAAHSRLREQHQFQRFESPEEVREFFQACDAVEGPGTEPDWNEHLRVINQLQRKGFTGVEHCPH